MYVVKIFTNLVCVIYGFIILYDFLCVVIISSPDIVTGETYTVNIGSDSGEFTAK